MAVLFIPDGNIHPSIRSVQTLESRCSPHVSSPASHGWRCTRCLWLSLFLCWMFYQIPTKFNMSFLYSETKILTPTLCNASSRPQFLSSCISQHRPRLERYLTHALLFRFLTSLKICSHFRYFSLKVCLFHSIKKRLFNIYSTTRPVYCFLPEGLLVILKLKS